MRKATHFKVSGVLETKPTNLPEGVDVEEVEVEIKLDDLVVCTITGESLRFVDSVTRQNTVGILGVGLLREGDTRKLRDFLNMILEESSPTIRVFKDSDGDVWFELQPNKFTMGSRSTSGYEVVRARAEKRVLDFAQTGYPDSFLERSFEYVDTQYGPLTVYKPQGE